MTISCEYAMLMEIRWHRNDSAWRPMQQQASGSGRLPVELMDS